MIQLSVPARLAQRPCFQGRPVPWFVAWLDGVPDFRVIGAGKIPQAVRENRCWICGDKLGKYKTFLLGPMCAINRIISEPPSHKDCAEYSARVCPFLSDPARGRRTHHLPQELTPAAGHGIARNPGAVALWTTFSFQPFSAHHGNKGVLFEVGDPEEILWFAEGRAATRAEVLHSIKTGLPVLVDDATKQGIEALQELNRRLTLAYSYLPPLEEEDHPKGETHE